MALLLPHDPDPPGPSAVIIVHLIDGQAVATPQF
jgi:hypothetical protein